MADAAQARSDDASRNDDIRLVSPSLTELVMAEATKPFGFIDEPDLILDQAFAMLRIIAGAYRDQAAIGQDGINVDDLDHNAALDDLDPNLLANAVDGVASIVALASHGVHLERFNRAARERSAVEEPTNG